jgi:hypothetical protein
MKKLTKILSITAAFTVLSALAMTANASDDLFTELYINADGTISITEAEAHEVLLANFAAVDIDSDGYVTKGELVASGIS